MNRARLLATALWAAYFALAPVTWFPGLEQAAYQGLKIILVGAAVLASLVAWRPVRLARGLVGPVGLLVLLAASVFAVAQASSTGLAVRRELEIVAAFLFLFIWSGSERGRGALVLPAGIAALVHGVFGYIIVAAENLPFDLLAPETARSAVPGALSVTQSGFAWSRTDWSAGVALFVAFAVVWAIGSRSVVVRVLAGIAVAGTFAGQVVVAGRSGLIVTILVCIALPAVRWGWRGLAASTLGVGSVSIVVAATNWERLRLDRLFGLAPDDADFSSGRWDLYQFGWEQIQERPIIGHGYGVPMKELVPGSPLEIHHLWLRLWAEGGVLLPLALGAITAVAVAAGVRAMGQAAGAGGSAVLAPAAAMGTVCGGVVISIFEPNVFLGNVHLTVIWWCAAGWLVSAAGAMPGRDPGAGTLFGIQT